ncbi:putative repeat protein (TIGR03806 family) [Epilithonimonas hungarica]|uniref:hypothetical protein n=1 Tax=Epilithonimonas hungarica TaxID=454006 RepID=UPI0027839094|nr:hypothetical protein [Epilithonimonas hungarica]MDP9957005.1 putative repeat protein (TIGR03806 family) [Epilithonimonas hungarica]
MKKIYFLYIVSLFLLFSCKEDDGTVIETSISGPTVNFDINAVPYSKLSTYSFFSGDLKDLTPVAKVIPYEPASSLFTDYALKKRFIWMPEGTKAKYEEDGKTLDFPVGTTLIKNFYYNTLQPNNTTKIIETRLMIRKSTGWIFAEYIWNDAQTEATLLTGEDFESGSSKEITFKKPNGESITTNYRIPSETECFACHRLDGKSIPIGTKPQNLNNIYNYSTTNIKNQLQKLVDEGYLASYPSTINSTVDYHDTSKPVDIRLRSYLDANCSHCHQQNARCDYRALRLQFNQTTNLTNLGVCLTAAEPVSSTISKIVAPGNYNKSVMHYRLQSTDGSNMMPLLGRTVVHDEGLLLVQEWISSLTQTCN